MADKTLSVVVGNVYAYDLANDVVTAIGGAPVASLPLAQLMRPSLQLRARITRAPDILVGDGFRVTLATEIDDAFAIGVLNVAGKTLPNPLAISLVARNAGAATTFDTGTNEAIRPSGVWATHESNSPLLDNPIRGVWVAGLDDLTTPSSVSPFAITEFDVKDVTFLTQSASGGTFLQLGYLAIGINGNILNAADVSGVQSRPIPLNLGYGVQTTITWTSMPYEDSVVLDNLWNQSSGGHFPAIVMPRPDRKASDGTLSSTTSDPSNRGGVVRLVSWTKTGVDATVGGRATGCGLVYHTWQETLAKEGR